MGNLQSWLASLPVFARDAIGVGALALIVWGIAKIFVPAAMIIGGGIVLFAVLVHAGVIKLPSGS